MFLDASVWQAIAVVGGVGALAGLIGGLIGGADSLLGALLMGAIGGVAGATIMKIGGAPGISTVGDGFSIVWAAAGGLILGFVVGMAN